MLNLILGPDHKMNTKYLLGWILEKTAAGKGCQYLIVPEQFSFEMERILCRLGGDSISRYAEVLSLTRLAGRVESIYGGTGNLWLDKGGRLLAAAQAVEQVHSRLKLFASVCRKPEFLESFLTIVDEFGGYGVTTEQLSQMATDFTGQFSQKLQELALLYESYLSVCTQAKDPVARLQNLRDVLETEDFAEGKDFYVCQFGDFTLLEREILENLIQTADSVTITLPEETVGGLPVFPASKSAASALLKSCRRSGIETRVQQLGFDERVSVGLMHLQKTAAQTESDFWTKSAPELLFTRFQTVEQECRNAALQIRKLVEKGARYRDIAVACSDYAAYGPVLERVLGLAGIPCFASQKNPATSLCGVRMVLSAIRAAGCGMERETVIEYLKTGASTLTVDQCDRLENYAYLWNVNGNRWAQEWTWHPAGVGTPWREEDHQRLTQLNSWRDQGLAPLLHLRMKLLDSETVGDMAAAVFEFMTEIHFAEKMQEMADHLFDLEEYQRSQQYGQLYDILVDALEQMSLVMENAVRPPEEFYRLCETLLKQYTVGTVPAAADEVMIGEIAAFRGKEVPHLLVLGASEGSFPACAQGSGIFTEEERRSLLSAGLSMAPLRVDAVDRELGNIYHCIRSASRTFSMSCTGEASYLFSKIARLFGGIHDADDTQIALNEDEYAAILLRTEKQPKHNKIAEKMDRLRQRCSYAFGVLSPEQVQGLYGSELYLSASRIDKFASCRFAYFLRYGMKAQERKEARFDASAFGSFVHAVLEKTAKEVMERGGFHTVSDEELQKIASTVMNEYAAEQLTDLTEQDARFRYLFARNREEAMAVVRDLGEEMRLSDFSPAAFEMDFSDSGVMPPVRVKGKTTACAVSGFVDRVDLYHHGDTAYVRVVDYKTGRKEFDYTDITIGEGMQMLIYLFALTQNGEKAFGEKLQPAGVLYLPARQDVLSNTSRPTEEDAKRQHQKAKMRKGLISDNDVVIGAMEHFETEPQYLPFSIKKDGRVGDLADSGQMRRLQRHVFTTLGKMADEIGSGMVSPNPVIRGPGNSACTYCEYRSVCQKDFASQEERYLKKISNKEFFEFLKREEACYGET